MTEQRARRLSTRAVLSPRRRRRSAGARGPRCPPGRELLPRTPRRPLRWSALRSMMTSCRRRCAPISRPLSRSAVRRSTSRPPRHEREPGRLRHRPRRERGNDDVRGLRAGRPEQRLAGRQQHQGLHVGAAAPARGRGPGVDRRPARSVAAGVPAVARRPDPAAAEHDQWHRRRTTRQPAFQEDYVADPQTRFSAERFVGYVTGAPSTIGYSYSNTNYVLAEMILERVSGQSYRELLQERIIEPLGLRDTYYRAHPLPVRGDQPRTRRLLLRRPGARVLRAASGATSAGTRCPGRRAAGGIISTTSDLTLWERALYAGRLLPPGQQAELTSLVSTATGQPIEQRR